MTNTLNKFAQQLAKLKPKNGDLRVWWTPQVPMQAFHFPVASVAEGRLLIDALAQYDLFQLRHNVKGDYCNAGGLQAFSVFDTDGGKNPNGSWLEWHSWEGLGVDDFTLADLRAVQPKWEYDGLTAKDFA